MNLIMKTFLISFIFAGVNVAFASPQDQKISDQVRLNTMAMGDENHPYTKPAETTQTTTPINKDESAQNQSAQSEESKLMEQSQSMDESTATKDKDPANQQKTSTNSRP